MDLGAVMAASRVRRAAGVVVLAWVLALFVNGVPAVAGQVELPALPGQVELVAAQATQLRLGVHAEDPISQLTVGGVPLAGTLLHEGTVLVPGDGTVLYAYHDLFRRRYRGRKQTLISLEGHPVEDLNQLPPGAQLPKVLLDADHIAAQDLYLDGAKDLLFLTGEIVWRFDFGLPVLAVAFSDPLLRRHTMVDDGNWQEAGEGVRVSLSSDGSTWHEVWRSQGEGGFSEVTGELPPELEGATTLYLRIQATENFLLSLYFSAQLDGGSVEPALALGEGEQTLDVGAASGGAALVFWDNPEVTVPAGGEEPPSQPEIHGVGDRIRVRFPGGAVAEFCRDASGPVTGPCRIAAGDLSLLDRAAGVPGGAELIMLDGDPIQPYTDWSAARDEFLAQGSWPSTGSRVLRELSLASGSFVGPEVWGDGTVVLRQTVSDGDATGELLWLVREERLHLAGRSWYGVSWRVILVGLPDAMYLEVDEPMALTFGQWWIEQVFRGVMDDQVDFTAPYDLAPTRLFGSSQSFRFTAGPAGETMGFFQEPVVSNVEVREERGRRVARTRIPLGVGMIRATPWRTWVASERSAADRWEANDAWAEARDAYTAFLGASIGVRPNLPSPTLAVVQPSEAYVNYWLDHQQPLDGVYWFDDLRNTLLPAAHDVGIETIYIQLPWDSDAEHTDGGFSGQAVREMVPSPAMGGQARMRAMIDRAHELGMEVVLWYPSTLSPFSEYLEEHPDWAMYTAAGIPDNGGWPDIVNVDLHSGFLPWMIRRLRDLSRDLGFDGLWLDSWDGITLGTDFKGAQPAPQMDGALQLIRAMWSLGLDQVITEGLTPFAQGDAYGDYESWSGPPVTNDDVERSVAQIRGREYLLYRIKAGAPLNDMGLYRRALAAGGVLLVPNMDEVDALTSDQHEELVTANRVWARVVPWMQHRQLVGDGDTWKGVRWRRDGSPGWVVFAFQGFDESVPQGMKVLDLVTETAVEVSGGVFTTQAWHTYRVAPAREARRGAGR